MHIHGKTFVVTGASGGIGSELVSALLQQGCKVVAVDLRAKDLQALCQRLTDTSANPPIDPSRLSIVALDITDSAAVAKLPARVAKEFGAVDGVINCAGIIQPFVRINDLDDATIQRVMNVNFFGTLHVVKAFLPQLLERPEASLVNVSSMGGFLPVPGQGIYGASKAAVKLMTESLYAELLDTAVHVMLVFPGATRTNITANSGVVAPIDPNSQAASSYPTLPPDQAAAQIIQGIERNKPQVFTGRDSKLANRLYRLNPLLATRLIASQMKRLLPT